MAPRGIASAIGMAVAVPLMKRYSVRWILFISISITAISSYMLSQLTLDINTSDIVLPTMAQGFGMGLFFVPVSTIVASTLVKKQTQEAMGLFSYGRMLGISLGISALSTIITRQTQMNWNRLGGNISEFNPNFVERNINGFSSDAHWHLDHGRGWLFVKGPGSLNHDRI